MKKHLFVPVILPLAMTVIALSSYGCKSGESPSADTITDSITADTETDSQTADIIDVSADTSGDLTGDIDQEGVDAADISDTVADSGTPDVAPIVTRGMFRLDYASTDATGRNQFTTLTKDDHQAVAVNECGGMGIVFVDKILDQNQKFSTSLIFSEINLANPPDIDTPPSRVTLYQESDTDEPALMHPSLVYEDCIPIVINQTSTGFQMTTVGGGLIEWTPVDLGAEYSQIENFGAMIGRDNKIHLVFRGRPAGGTMQWINATYNGTGFDKASYPPADTAMQDVAGVAISDEGLLYVGYTRKNVSNELEVWVAHNTGSAWEKQQIPDVTPSEFGVSFTIGSYNREGVAWNQTVTSDDGFLLSSSLKYTYRDTNNLFKTESVVVENDGYTGGAGNRMTGAWPEMVIDASGRPHIMFSDLAVTVSGPDQTISAGQLRYMWRKNKAWAHSTVHHQDSPVGRQTSSIDFKGIGLNGTGTDAGIVVIAVTSDSEGTIGLDTLGWSILNSTDL